MKIGFLNERGDLVTKIIPSYYQGQKFLQKLRHSKRCKLVFYSKL